MSDKTKTPQVQRIQAATPDGHGMEWGTNPAAALMAGSQRAFTHWFEAMVALSQEMTEFTQTRMREDMTAWSALAACRDPGEALECQKRFAATASKQYADEFAALSRLLVNATQGGLAAVDRRPPANA